MPESLVFENTGDTKHRTALARSRVLPVLLLIALSLVVVPPSSAGASPTVPGPPTAVSGTAGNGLVALHWTAPASDGGAAITDYQVRVYNAGGGAPAGVSGATTRAVGSAATSYSFTGLTNGTMYTFKVAAVNAAGTGSQSALSAPVDVGTPTAPTAVKAMSGYVGGTTGPLKVTFTPGANNGSAVTSFTATCTSTTGGVAGSLSASASPINVLDLTRGETYTCTVTATNARGVGQASTPSPPVIVGSPGPPIDVDALWVASNQLRVTFTPGGNNGNEIASFTATCTSKNGGVTSVATRSSSPITVKALTPGRTYTCTVTATNSRGEGLPSTPTGPGAPTGVSATAGDASAVVSWSAPTGPNGGSPITGYDVTVTPGSRVVPVADPSARNATVVALTPGTAYTFTVAARNEVGPGTKSAASNSVTPYIGVSIGDASVWEGTGFSVSASFAVTLSYPATQPLSVNYASAPGTASAGSDYTGISGTQSFSVGETTKVVTVTVLGDSTVEPTETFTVTLTNPTNVRLGDANGLGTIRDDDSWTGQNLAVSDATVHEGDSGNRTVQLAIRAKVNAFPVNIAYSVVRGSAEDADFDASPPQTLQLTGPNTLRTFTVKPDVLQEGDERFGIYISSPTIPALDPRGVATIFDNDLRAAPASPLFPTFTTSDVWTAPSPLPPGPPGDVIWSIPTPAPVPPYATTKTMLYRSRSALGDDVAISGWVIVPNGTPPAGGWPVLAWGHWTQGMDDSCAPTRHLNPTGIPYINDYIAAKYVVVAPDYEGLGTTGPTAYWATEAYAHALLDGIRAARKLVPAASNHAVLFGGSEGGLAATSAAELWPYYAPEIDVRGAAGSGPGVASSLAETIAVRNAGGFVANSLAMVAGQNNAYPNAGIPSYYLTAAGIQELSAIQTVCSGQFASYPNTTGLFQPWLADPLVPPAMSATIASAEDRDNLTRRAPAVPVLYVHGRNDTNFPPVFLPPFVERLCALGTTVDLRWYDGGHMPFTASKSDVIAWIAARFAGSAAPTSCANIQHSENVAPTVTSIVRTSSNPTNASSVAWTVTFSEAVTGVAPANFSLAATGPSGAAITGITGSGTTRTVTASTGTGNGDLGLNLSDTSGIIDAAANKLSATFTGSAYTIDKSAPTVVSIVQSNPNPTNAASVTWTVAFDENVTGVTPANFSLAATGLSGAAITGQTGAGKTRIVTASTGTGNGTLRLNLSDTSGIVDAAANQLSAPFTGWMYTIDKTAPTVVSIAPAGSTPTNAGSVAWTVTFSEAVKGVGAANFSLASTGPSGASITGITGTGKTRTVTASTGTGNGDLGLNLSNTSGITDNATNPLSAPFTGSAYTIDKTAPTVLSIARADPSPTNAAGVAWTVTFSEGVTGVATANFSLSGTSAGTASITGVTGAGDTWTVTASTGTPPGFLGLDLTDTSGVLDVAGNGLSNTLAGETYEIVT